MKKTNTTEILKEELANNTQQQPRLYAINAIRPALLARAISGGRRALRQKDAEEAGVTSERFTAWKNTVDNLYEASCAFYEALGTPEEQTAADEVMKRWKDCVRCGEQDAITPRMYIRPTDVHNCRVWACEIDSKVVRGIGVVPVYTGVDKFRGIIETRIALRIAGNAALKDEDRATLETYEKACKAVDAASKILNGYTEGKTVVASIDAQILDAENVLNQVTEALKAAGIENVEELTSRQKAAVDNLKEEKNKATKRLKKWSQVKTDTQAKYDVIIDTLDSIEGIANEAPVATETTAQKDERLSNALEAAKAKVAAEQKK